MIEMILRGLFAIFLGICIALIAGKVGSHKKKKELEKLNSEMVEKINSQRDRKFDVGGVQMSPQKFYIPETDEKGVRKLVQVDLKQEVSQQLRNQKTSSGEPLNASPEPETAPEPPIPKETPKFKVSKSKKKKPVKKKSPWVKDAKDVKNVKKPAKKKVPSKKKAKK